MLAGICAYADSVYSGSGVSDEEAAQEAEKQHAKIEVYKSKGAFKEEKNVYYGAAKLYHKVAIRSSDRSEKAEYFLKEAECLRLANKTHKASEAYKKLMKEYSLYIPYDDVVAKLRGISEDFVNGHGTFWGIRDKSAAISNYFFILLEAPSIHVSLDDRLRLAELLREAKRREEAVVVYQDILKLDPTLDDVRLELANLLIEIAKRGDGDGSICRSAVRQAKFILERNPKYGRRDEVELIIAEANDQEAVKLLELGQFYLKGAHKRPEAAKAYLQDLIKRFPNSKASWEAQKILDNLDADKK